jgi:hypothetical protein
LLQRQDNLVQLSLGALRDLCLFVPDVLLTAGSHPSSSLAVEPGDVLTDGAGARCSAAQGMALRAVTAML